MRKLTPYTGENYVLKVFSVSPKKMFKKPVKGVHDLVEGVHASVEGVHDLVEGVEAVESVVDA